MNTLLEVIRTISPWGFLALCLGSYFSGMLLALLVRFIKRTSWERTPLLLRLAYQLLRAFREYVTAAPVGDDLRLPVISRA